MRSLSSLLLSLFLSSQAMALGLGHSFSALAVQQYPGQPERQAVIYVTPDKVRMEFSNGQDARIEITDMTAGVSHVLLPAQRVYATRSASPAVSRQLQQSAGPVTPCAVPSDAVCRKLGQEQLFGRLADRWEMVLTQDGRQYRSEYWIDVERAMPLRQVWADGTVTELQPAGRKARDGRQAEKWQLVMRLPDGSVQQGEQWLDTQLQIMTAERMPGGYSRELRNIKVAAQAASLFEIPAGYRQVAADSLLPNRQLQGRP